MIRETMYELAHGWRITGAAAGAEELIGGFIEPAMRAVPPAMAARLGPGLVLLGLDDAESSSRWTITDNGVEVELATEEIEAHDVAMELFVCLGQVLWEDVTAAECDHFLRLLSAELDAGVTGEIDEQALDEKRWLLSSAVLARSRNRLLRYAGASFASTAAEYVHCLWHDVEVRTGPDHLPAGWLRKRLDLLASWFPPGEGYFLLV